MVQFNPNFDDAKIYGDVPQGQYKVQCTQVEPAYPGDATAENPYKADGSKANQMIKVWLQIVDDPELSGQDLRPLYGFIEGEHAGFGFGYVKALMPSYEKGEPFTDDDLVGKECIAVVEDQMYQGQKQAANVARLQPLAQ